MSAVTRPESATPVALGESDRSDASAKTSRRHVLLVLAVICAASFLLYIRWVVRPYLFVDDFQILLRSWTWERSWHDLWVPANEHAMPVGRLTTCVLVQLAGRAAVVPCLAALQGPLALVAGTLLVYLFVRRELGHPFFGLAAAALFGVSTVYEQAVYWFSSSFSILTLDTILLALLAAQSWRQTRRPVYLVLCVLGVALAPTWFASGILAGPCCALYLLLPERDAMAGRDRVPVLVRSALFAVIPLLGTALFLAVSLPQTAKAIMHLPHYEGKTALESFQPLPGALITLWSIVASLLLGAFGISSIRVPLGFAVAVWPLLIAGGVWWWVGAPAGRRLMLLGLGLIVTSYLLVYSARVGYITERTMNVPLWSRYHLLPQLGLALFVVGGLPRWAEAWRLAGRPVMTQVHTAVLLVVVALLAVTQFPRTLWTEWTPEDDSQLQVLRQIDDTDALCRRYHIGKETAREALGVLDIPGCLGRENGWDFLRGSPDPDPTITPEQARGLLTAPPKS